MEVRKVQKVISEAQSTTKRRKNFLLPGYGTLPFVTSSVSKIPNDHTSDLIVNRPYNAASGAVHLIGNLAPANIKKTDI